MTQDYLLVPPGKAMARLALPAGSPTSHARIQGGGGVRVGTMWWWSFASHNSGDAGSGPCNRRKTWRLLCISGGSSPRGPAVLQPWSHVTFDCPSLVVPCHLELRLEFKRKKEPSVIAVALHTRGNQGISHSPIHLSPSLLDLSFRNGHWAARRGGHTDGDGGWAGGERAEEAKCSGQGTGKVPSRGHGPVPARLPGAGRLCPRRRTGESEAYTLVTLLTHGTLYADDGMKLVVAEAAETQQQGQQGQQQRQQTAGHRFCGYYFPYPGPDQHQGLVSTVADDPPMLNWIYVDGQTGAVRHGARKDTVGHVIGPWGWSDDEAWLTLEGGPGGFVARREADEGGCVCWVVYWDPAAGGDDDDDDDDDDDGDGDDDVDERVVRLRRRPLLGVESRYVRDSAKA